MFIDIFSNSSFFSDTYWLDITKTLNDRIVFLEKKILDLKQEKSFLYQTQVQLKQEISLAQREMLTFQKQYLEEQKKCQMGFEELEKVSQDKSWLERQRKIFLEEFSKLQEKYQLCVNALLECQKRLEEFEKTQKLNEKEESKKAYVDSVLFYRLFLGDVVISDVKQILQEEGCDISEAEIYQRIHALKSEIRMDESFLVNGQVAYRIDKRIPNEGKLMISVDESKPFEFLCYSDFHCNDKNFKDCFSKMEILNEYCIQSGISYAFHLGDFFSFRPVPTVENFQKVKMIQKQIVSSFPVEPSILYGFLGGNHDAYFLRFGIDSVYDMCKSRANFVSLGYDHCKVNFQGIPEGIGFHHPKSRMPVDLSFQSFENYLNQYYKKYGGNRSMFVYDFLGHTHQCYMDSNFTLVPSITRDQRQNGALHVQIYFSKGRMDSLIVRPIFVSDCVVVGEEQFIKVKQR